MTRILLFISLFGLFTASGYLCLVLVACLRFAWRKLARPVRRMEKLPAVSVMKPLHGFEPELRRNLESFFQQDYPEFELIFCARQDSDPALTLAREIASRYPQVNTRFLTSGPPRFANAKVASLERMSAIARYDLFVISDSDVCVAPNYLQEVVQPLSDPRVSLVTCAYRGVTRFGFVAQLDAAGKTVEMTSGVLVADMLEGMKFALGPTMVTRRETIRQAGGFDELGRYYADDFVLGNNLARQGKKVVLSDHIIELAIVDPGFWGSVSNQLRWARSTRHSRALGHLGSGLTYAAPFGLLGLAWGVRTGHPLLGLGLLGLAVGNRMLQAWAVTTWVVRSRQWLRTTLIYPVRDLLGFCIWVASYLGSDMRWRGERYTFKAGGRIEKVAVPAPIPDFDPNTSPAMDALRNRP